MRARRVSNSSLNARRIAAQRDGQRGFRVSSSAGEFRADTLVVATGGLSIPKLGATGLAYDLARQFGLRIIEPRPALVPLVLGGEEARWTELAGVSADVIASATRRERQSSLSSRISREDADHPSRAQRPGHPAGFLVLAARRSADRRFRTAA